MLKDDIFKRRVFIASILALLAVPLFGISLSVGAAKISVVDVYKVVFSRVFGFDDGVDSSVEYIVWDLRLPRVLGALIVGATLAAAGAVLQIILRNPMASEYTLGLGAAAVFGAALAIVAGAGFISRYPYVPVIVDAWAVILNAFLFALLDAAVIAAIARMRGSSPVTVVLAGIALFYLFSAGTSILQYFSQVEALKALVIWLLGDLGRMSWQYLPWASASLLFIAVLLFYSWKINAFILGEEVAESLGVNVKKLRALVVVCASAMTALTIPFVGVIGFVGLIAPHIARFAVGSNARHLIVASALVGADMLLAADLVARVAVAPLELPIGAVMASVGGPFFLYLLLKSRREHWL